MASDKVKGIIKNAKKNYNKNTNINTGDSKVKEFRQVAKMTGNNTIGDMLRCGDDFGSQNLKSMALKKKFDEEILNGLIELKGHICNISLEVQYNELTGEGTTNPKETKSYKEFEKAAKAFDSSDFSVLIPSYNTDFYYEELEILPGALEAALPSWPMKRPTQNIPIISDRFYGRLQGETDTFGVQSLSSSSVSATAKSNVVHTEIYQDFMDDQDPSIMNKIRQDLALGIPRSMERALLNGDDSGTHMDTDVTVATDFRKAFKGLRKLALDNSGNGSLIDAEGNVISLEILRKLWRKMPKSMKSNLRWIYSPTTNVDVGSGAIPEVQTVQNVGMQAATILNGEPIPFFGIKPIESEYMREDLTSAGVYGGALTALILLDLSRFRIGNRTGTRFWMERAHPDVDKIMMTAKKRHTFVGIPQGADEISVAMAHNLYI
jgi:hypothetical protein